MPQPQDLGDDKDKNILIRL